MSETQAAPPTLKDTVRRAFELAHKAKQIRDEIANLLPRATGRDYSVGTRIYSVLSDLTVNFAHLEDRIAEIHSLGRYLGEI